MFSSIPEFWRLARPFKKRLTIVTGLLCVDSIVTGFSVLTIAPLTDLVLGKSEAEWLPVTHKIESVYSAIGIPFSTVTVAAMFFLLTLGMAVFSVFVRWSMSRLRIAVIQRLIDQSMMKMFSASWGYFTDTNRGTLANTYISEVNNTGSAFLSITVAFSGVVRILALLAVPLLLEPKLVIICLIASILLILPFMYIGKWSKYFGDINVKAANRFASLLRESVEAAREVISFGRQQPTINQISKAYQRFGDSRVKAETFGYFSSQMYEPVGILVIMIVLLVNTSSSQSIPLASVAVVLWGLIRTVAPLKQLIQLKHNIDSRVPSLRQVLNEQKKAESYRQPQGIEFEDLEDVRVEFEDVKFSYKGHTPALDGCSFRSGGQEMLAFVGESGSGKSTIVDLILGLQQPESGKVLLNGVDSSKIDLARWRRELSIVPQQPVLFDLSIRDNLLWANPEASNTEIWRVLDAASARKFVENLKDGLDTEIGDSGIRLSGGQVQRLAIARALIRKPKLLILDEATSALDMETEANIYQSLARETKDCLVIVVAHRLSTISSADQILVFRNGKIIEKGTYQELDTSKGYFHRLLHTQPAMRAA